MYCTVFDEGVQRSFLSEDMASELQITPTSTVDIAMASFGSTSTCNQKLGVATVEVQTESGESIPVSVLIVPSIAAPIQNLVPSSVYTMPHLRNLKLAHPVVIITHCIYTTVRYFMPRSGQLTKVTSSKTRRYIWCVEKRNDYADIGTFHPEDDGYQLIKANIINTYCPN